MFSRSALLTIDVQQDFIAGSATISGTAECVPAMSRVAEAFRVTGRPIIHVVRLYLPDGSNAEAVRRSAVTSASIVRPGTRGSQVAPELLPPRAPALDPEVLLSGRLQQIGPTEWFMYKPRWGAFYGTALENHLRGLEIEDVVFVGCNFPNCPRTSLYEAGERDFGTILISDAVSGVYQRGLDEITSIGATVLTSDEAVAGFT
ncbi:cysteine hydrolase family protein [Brevibacterium daeguense]|nr:isochorismatase family cysteine hydrolase [Brevibacterium daeguense]